MSLTFRSFAWLLIPLSVACGSKIGAGDDRVGSWTPTPPTVARPRVGSPGATAERLASLRGLGPDGDRSSGTLSPRAAQPETGSEPSALPRPEDAASSPLLRCAGRRTTRLAIAGNLDPDTLEIEAPFDVHAAANTAHFSSTFTIFDGGVLDTLEVYFRRGARAWEYHALNREVEVGSGSLVFDEEGALSHLERSQALLLPGLEREPLGLFLGTPLDEGGTGRDGITSMPGPSTLSYAEVDGAPTSIGAACPDSVSGAAPSSRAPVCAPARTTRIAVVANLPSGTKLSGTWNALQPEATSAHRAQLFAYDSSGAAAKMDLYFRRLTQQKWEYRVLLGGNEPGRELGRGQLLFNLDGSLARHEQGAALRLPSAGAEADVIELDFGRGSEEGGSGVDGTTSLPQPTWVQHISRDGHAASFAACSSAFPSGTENDVPAAFWRDVYGETPAPLPVEPGRMTTWIRVSVCVTPTTAVVSDAFDPANAFLGVDAVFAVRVWDAHLTETNLNLFLRHEAARTWRGYWIGPTGLLPHVLRLDFSETGSLAAWGGAHELRLPLPGGRPGPAIRLSLVGALDAQGVEQTATPAWCSDPSWWDIAADGQASGEATGG